MSVHSEFVGQFDHHGASWIEALLGDVGVTCPEINFGLGPAAPTPKTSLADERNFQLMSNLT